MGVHQAESRIVRDRAWFEEGREGGAENVASVPLAYAERLARLSTDMDDEGPALGEQNEPRRWTLALKLAPLMRFIKRAAPPPLSGWTRTRDLPDPPPEPFRDWWTRTRGQK